MHESGTKKLWENMKKLMGQKTTDKSNVQSLANKTTDGNVELLASKMNDFFVSDSEHLLRLDRNNEAFDVEGQLPDEYVIDLTTTLQAIRNVKTNKATGPGNVPAWILKNHANIVAGPLTAISNSSLRECIIPDTWKSANVIPVPKVNPPNTIEKDVIPISFTPKHSKALESIILSMVNENIVENINCNQFGGMGGAATTDALVEIIHIWSVATDNLDHYVRVALLDFSKAFDLINRNTLLVKLKQYDLPPHIRSWIATFLLDRTQQVKIGNNFSPPGHPRGAVPQGTLLGPKCFLVYINDLETPVPLYKYVDDSTLFEICHRTSESVLQHSVDIAARWTRHNDMKINSGKSKVTLISFMQDPYFSSTIPRLIIDGNEIDNVQYAKLLGVTISNDLTWNKHVENIIAKPGKRVYMLCQLKRAGIGQHDLVTIYVIVIRPVLEYACPVWHTNLNKHLTESIETVQKRAMTCISPGFFF